ncbi:MAG: methyl-accepting chemotaxis protein [Alphaproteobacteria bacterium]|nr:methyl-accepting chemotaxis protein [Alphaproteobacteria bacterium]
MDFNNVFVIVGASIMGLAFIAMMMLFFISRKSQRVMKSVVSIMTEPDRARIADASRVLQTIMADEIKQIAACFQSMHATMNAQITDAQKLRDELAQRNQELVSTANEAIQRVVQMTGRMDNSISGLTQLVTSESWDNVTNATDRFAQTVGETLTKITETTNDSNDKIAQIDAKIAQWADGAVNLGNQLNTALETNTEQFQKMAEDANTIQGAIAELTKTSLDGFNQIKESAENYEDVLGENNKIVNTYLTKLDTFGKQSKKQLTAQMNTLTNTANVVGAQVLLSESSIEKQIKKLTDAVESLMTSATETESAVRGISTELSGLTNHFENEIKDFAGDVVGELKTVSGVANDTLKDTKTAANAFSESVKSMATGVRETLIEMNAAHTQLTGQSQGLIKMSMDTTAQLKPLSELIDKYYEALPELARQSGDAGIGLGKIVSELDEKIATIRDTVEKATIAVADSAVKLENLAGGSRQQMIDLMSDYAKAVDTMQTLNKQMMVARAAAPMEAIKSAGTSAPMPRASGRDFLESSTHEFDKMYEQTIDLTRAMGGEIPDVVWKKYHDGDKTIFAKWMSKIIRAANKKQIRELLKSDSVFRSQATQFVRSFDKIMAAARQTDNADKLVAGLIKTDLGVIYSALSPQI